MPRDSSGTMTLAEAAFVGGTTIVAADVNSDLSDIASEMTDSLSRSGKGGMTAPLRVANGSAAAPSYAFSNDTGVGIYRSASGEASIAAGGGDIASWDSTGFYVGTGTLPLDSKQINTAFVSSNVTTTSSAMGSVTGLSFSVVASGTYAFSAVLSVSRAGTATNFQIDFSGPAAPTAVQYMATVTNAGTLQLSSSTAFSTALGLLQGVTINNGVFRIDGILVNGANAGTVQLRFASSDNTTTITALKGSVLHYQRLA